VAFRLLTTDVFDYKPPVENVLGQKLLITNAAKKPPRNISKYGEVRLEPTHFLKYLVINIANESFFTR